MKCMWFAMDNVLMRVELFTVVLPYQSCAECIHTIATLLYNGDVMVITL